MAVGEGQCEGRRVVGAAGAAGGNDTGTGAKGCSEGAGEEGHVGDLVGEEVAVGVGLVEGKLFVGTAGAGDDTATGTKEGGEETGEEVTSIFSNISFVL